MLKNQTFKISHKPVAWPQLV